MSIVEPQLSPRTFIVPSFPELKNGDRLTRIEFERRYAKVPPRCYPET